MRIGHVGRRVDWRWRCASTVRREQGAQIGIVFAFSCAYTDWLSSVSATLPTNPIQLTEAEIAGVEAGPVGGLKDDTGRPAPASAAKSSRRGWLFLIGNETKVGNAPQERHKVSNLHRRIFGVAAHMIGVATTLAAPAGIEQIGSLANGVSADGRTVAGAVDLPGELAAFRWTAESGLGVLGQGAALEVSRDGSAVVGEYGVLEGVQAFRWTAESGFAGLGSLPGGNGNSNAYDVNADGSVVVGLGGQSTGFRGFRWTEATGMTALGDLPGGFNFSAARSISRSGAVIVGVSTAGGGDRAVRWLDGNPTPINMGLPPGLSGFTEARGVSGDGDVVVGVWGSGQTNQAFRWTEGSGYTLLGDLAGGLVDSFATATNADGSVIIGVGNPGEELSDEAFYWTEQDGLRSLRDVLTGHGVDLSAWDTLLFANDLSDDGTVIVGSGLLTNGQVAGFRAIIPEPAAASLMLASLPFVIRRRSLPR